MREQREKRKKKRKRVSRSRELVLCFNFFKLLTVYMITSNYGQKNRTFRFPRSLQNHGRESTRWKSVNNCKTMAVLHAVINF